MSAGATIARVLPDVTGIDKHFDYLVPEELQSVVGVGSMVRVPLGPRQVRAWVVELVSHSDVESLRTLSSWSGIGPEQSVIELAEWAAHRWAGRARSLLVAASPPRLVKAPVTSPSGARSANGAVALDRSGGVLRVPPAADVLPVVLGAALHGPLLVCEPDSQRGALLAARLRRLGWSVAVMPRDWARAAGGVDVVIGSRSAVWAPCRGMAGVLVLDEQDETLQEERNPTWHARDVAIERARRAEVPVWLTSPIPSLEALHAFHGQVQHPSRVEERSGWPFVEVVSTDDDESPVRGPLSRRVFELVRDPGQRVICVLNTKGRARRLSCAACRQVAVCGTCDGPVSQGSDGSLRCARCGAHRPAVCSACGSTRLRALGRGVTRVREELEAAVRRPVLEVTSDTGEALIDNASANAIFLGTEAVLHRVRGATAVIFLDFDDELLAPRFRAAEQAMALVVRAARIVGPRAAGGRVVLQTTQPRHEVVQAALHADPSRLVGPEQERRRLLSMPPERALAAVTGTAAGSWLTSLPSGATATGPSNGRWLVRSTSWDTLADALSSLPARPRGVRVEVDPHRV